MTSVIPELELEVTKPRLHPFPELFSVNVLVQSTMQHEVWEGAGGIHQSRFVLGMWDGPNSDIGMLTSDGTHPAVFSFLVQFVTTGHAGLCKFLCGGSEKSERWIQQSRNKAED